MWPHRCWLWWKHGFCVLSRSHCPPSLSTLTSDWGLCLPWRQHLPFHEDQIKESGKAAAARFVPTAVQAPGRPCVGTGQPPGGLKCLQALVSLLSLRRALSQISGSGRSSRHLAFQPLICDLLGHLGGKLGECVLNTYCVYTQCLEGLIGTGFFYKVGI